MTAKMHRLGEGVFGHPAINRRAAKADLVLHCPSSEHLALSPVSAYGTDLRL